MKTRFEDTFERAKAKAGDELTKGEFFEMLLAAYEAKTSGVDLMRVAEIMQRDAVPPPKDREAGRTRVLTVFATEVLATALERRSVNQGWTVSETIEHACQVAQRTERKERGA